MGGIPLQFCNHYSSRPNRWCLFGRNQSSQDQHHSSKAACTCRNFCSSLPSAKPTYYSTNYKGKECIHHQIGKLGTCSFLGNAQLAICFGFLLLARTQMKTLFQKDACRRASAFCLRSLKTLSRVFLA